MTTIIPTIIAFAIFGWFLWGMLKSAGGASCEEDYMRFEMWRAGR